MGLDSAVELDAGCISEIEADTLSTPDPLADVPATLLDHVQTGRKVYVRSTVEIELTTVDSRREIHRSPVEIFITARAAANRRLWNRAGVGIIPDSTAGFDIVYRTAVVNDPVALDADFGCVEVRSTVEDGSWTGGRVNMNLTSWHCHVRAAVDEE